MGFQQCLQILPQLLPHRHFALGQAEGNWKGERRRRQDKVIHFLFDRKVRQLDLTYTSFSCQVIAILLKSPVLTKQRVYIC